MSAQQKLSCPALRRMDERAKALLESGHTFSEWTKHFLGGLVADHVVWGSVKQNQLISTIEIKVFGEVREYKGNE